MFIIFIQNYLISTFVPAYALCPPSTLILLEFLFVFSPSELDEEDEDYPASLSSDRAEFVSTLLSGELLL